MRFAFHPEARLEYREAARFYEARRTGLGAAFTREVESVIARILEAPERWRFIEKDVHICRTRMFPYAILYTVEGDSLLIIAIAHGSREPGYWRHRLQSEGQ